MITRTITIRQFAEARKKLALKFPHVLRAGLTDAGGRVVYALRDQTLASGITSSGEGLLSSWRTKAEIVKGGGNLVVWNSQPYSAVVEYGRRPGARMPPTRFIARWAQRKLGLSAKEAQRAAFPIAVNIAKRGIPGKHILEKATPKIEAIIKESIERMIERALAQGGAP